MRWTCTRTEEDSADKLDWRQNGDDAWTSKIVSCAPTLANARRFDIGAVGDCVESMNANELRALLADADVRQPAFAAVGDRDPAYWAQLVAAYDDRGRVDRTVNELQTIAKRAGCTLVQGPLT